MYWIHSIITVFLFQSSIGLSIHRNRRQQTSGSLYGSSNPSQGFNANFYGTNLNNQNQNPSQGAKDLYGNPMIPGNSAPGLNNMGLPNQQQQQQQQQQQMYGANNQQLMNPPYGAGGAYQPPSGTNQVNPSSGFRDGNVNPNPNPNPLPPGASGSSFYSASNPQLNYPGSANQGLINKDLYNSAPNPNINNQFGSNPSQQQQQQHPQQQSLQYGLNNNNNQYPYGSTYNGQQIQPNPSLNNNNNNNNHLWPNNNNQYNTNLWSQNRQMDTSNTLNNNNNNNNLAYSNPNSNSPYFYNNNSAHSVSSAYLMFILSFLAIIFFHIY